MQTTNPSRFLQGNFEHVPFRGKQRVCLSGSHADVRAAAHCGRIGRPEAVSDRVWPVPEEEHPHRDDRQDVQEGQLRPVHGRGGARRAVYGRGDAAEGV